MLIQEGGTVPKPAWTRFSHRLLSSNSRLHRLWKPDTRRTRHRCDGNRLIFNSRSRYCNAEPVRSRYFVTAATCTCPHHNRGEFMLTAPRTLDRSDAEEIRLQFSR